MGKNGQESWASIWPKFQCVVPFKTAPHLASDAQIPEAEDVRTRPEHISAGLSFLSL